MKKFSTTLYRSTVHNTSVYISISYYSLTRHRSPKYSPTLCARAGSLVLQVSPCAVVRNLRLTLRLMLLLFPICLMYIEFRQNFSRLKAIPCISALVTIYRLRKMTSTTTPLTASFLCLSTLMVRLNSCGVRGRLSTTFFPKFSDSLKLTMARYYSLIHLLSVSQISSRPTSLPT